MARLDDPDAMDAEAARLRRQRRDLLDQAERRRWRLHRMPGLQQQLATATTNLMRLELEARRAKEHPDECENNPKRPFWWED